MLLLVFFVRENKKQISNGWHQEINQQKEESRKKMAPSKSSLREKSIVNFLKSFYKDYINVNYAKSLLFDPAKLPIVTVGILLVELILNIFIVQRIKYTEIDWIAYMQECEGFLNGTTNYALLKGK